MSVPCNFCKMSCVHDNEIVCLEMKVIKDHINNCFCKNKIIQSVSRDHALAMHYKQCKENHSSNSKNSTDNKELYFKNLMKFIQDKSLADKDYTKVWSYVYNDHGIIVGIRSLDGKIEYGYH